MRIRGGIVWIDDEPILVDTIHGTKEDFERKLGRRLTKVEIHGLFYYKAEAVWLSMYRHATALAGGSHSSNQNDTTFPSGMYEDNYIRTKIDQEHWT